MCFDGQGHAHDVGCVREDKELRTQLLVCREMSLTFYYPVTCIYESNYMTPPYHSCSSTCSYIRKEYQEIKTVSKGKKVMSVNCCQVMYHLLFA